MEKRNDSPDISVGFGKAAMMGTYFTDKKLADDVDIRTMAVKGNGATAVLAVADSCGLWPSTCLRIRAKLSETLDLAPENIGVFTTQNHSVRFLGGDDVRLIPDKTDKAFVDSALAAVANLRPVEIARIACRPKTALNICRRFGLPGFGKFSVYYGHRLIGDKADASHVIKNALNHLKAGNPQQIRTFNVTTGAESDFLVPPAPIPVPEPFFASPADDDLIQALFFRTLDGRPHGSLLRFASHPVAANHLEMDYQSGDFPAYARRYLEAEFGGFSLYLTGPCGDQTPLTGRKSLAFAKELGEKVAGEALKCLPGVSWERGGPVKVVSPVVDLPVRSDNPGDKASGAKEMRQLETRIKDLAAGDGNLPEIKRLSDRWEHLAFLVDDYFYETSGIRFDQLPDGKFPHPLFALKIGRSVIAGLPGEPYGACSVRVRENTLGDDCIVAEEANGWTSYHPTREEWPLGGYGPNMNVFGPDCEDVMARAMIKTINENLI